MSILSVFVLIPALMLLGLWLAKNLNQVRGVMVTGASCLLALSIRRYIGSDVAALQYHRVHRHLRLMAA